MFVAPRKAFGETLKRFQLSLTHLSSFLSLSKAKGHEQAIQCELEALYHAVGDGWGGPAGG